VSKAMIGVIAGLAALGLAGGVYFASRKKKP
jgi:LPXTG-motif cell wall-anchored protein